MISGLITGTLEYGLRREFLQNSFAIRDVQTYNFEIFSVNFNNSLAIQQQIQQQFSGIYSGDIRVTVFGTEQTFAYPSDAIRASKFKVSVEIKSPVANLSGQFPELTGAYYSGIDYGFWGNYGQYLLNFNEGFNFSTTSNGNRVFDHSLSFSVQTGASGTNTVSGRKAYAQQIASGIFAQDQNTTFGLYTMLGEISGLANTGVFRNFWNESYDLLKNTYSFGRKREELPFNSSGSVINLVNTLNLGQDGIVEVGERASTFGDISFAVAQANLENYLASSYGRCSGIYQEFYNTGIILQDPQYTGAGITNVGLLPLINTPTKITRVYDARSLIANYDVNYTNNPTFSGDGTITNQTLDFVVDTYGKTEATHSFEYTVNRIINPNTYFTGLFAKTTGQSPSYVASHYASDVSGVSLIYPNMNLLKSTINWPNIKVKASAKLYYSNSQIYFVTTNGMTFAMLDYTVENKVPSDVVQEYKIVNTPNKQSILSYAYATEKGEVVVSIKAIIGKKSNQFYPDAMGSFLGLGGGQTLASYLAALYKFGGQTFLSSFNQPTVAYNWFLNNTNYSLDSESNLSATLNYCYTAKRRLATNYP